MWGSGRQGRPGFLPQTCPVLEPLTPVPSSLQAVSLQLTAVSSPCPPSKPRVPAPGLHHTSTHQSQAGRRRAVTQTVHAGLILSCLVSELSSEPLKLPSVPADLPTRKRGFPRLRTLSSFPHRGAGPFPFPLCFLLSCLVAWGFSYPLRCLRSSASVQHVLCENCPVPNVPVGRGELHMLLLHYCDPSPLLSVLFFFFNRGGRMVDVLYHQT